MDIFTWFNGEVPSELEVKQVYGVLFTKDGRVLLRKEDDFYSLAGGTPEAFDKDMEATLRREVIEEVNTTIEKPVLVGYQRVNEGNGIPLYAQVRMAAIIKEIGPVQPDPDNGKTYQRILTTPSKAIKLLNWGESGRLMIEEATRVAKEILELKTFNDKEEFI